MHITVSVVDTTIYKHVSTLLTSSSSSSSNMYVCFFTVTSTCGCPENAICMDGQCECESGYQGDGETCGDVNECDEQASVADACHFYADCTNYPGGYSCRCQGGFRGDGTHCTGSHTLYLFSPSSHLEGFSISVGRPGYCQSPGIAIKNVNVRQPIHFDIPSDGVHAS